MMLPTSQDYCVDGSYVSKSPRTVLASSSSSLPLLFMNLSFPTKHDLFKDKGVSRSRLFPSRLVHVRIINRGREKHKQTKQKNEVRGGGRKRGTARKRVGKMKRLCLKSCFLDAQG